MKKVLAVVTTILVIFIVIFSNNNITGFILKNTVYKTDMAIQTPNQYEVKTNFSYVHTVAQEEPKNKEELFDLFYTIINSGFSKYTFFCPSSYKSCIEDVKKLTETQETLSHLNSFVHPYNSYSRIAVNMNSFGKVSVSVTKLYSEEQKKAVDQEIDRIMNLIIKNEMTVKEKIKVFHDYIVNTTVYDKEGAKYIKQGKADEKQNLSHLAYGTLFEHVSLCGGYSDTMAIFLSKLKIPNMKIANDEHVWNLIYLDDAWYHLDLTWDDPVVDTGENILLHNFFLITITDLLKKDSTYHNFDNTIYQEAKNN